MPLRLVLQNITAMFYTTAHSFALGLETPFFFFSRASNEIIIIKSSLRSVFKTLLHLWPRGRGFRPTLHTQPQPHLPLTPPAPAMPSSSSNVQLE